MHDIYIYAVPAYTHSQLAWMRARFIVEQLGNYVLLVGCTYGFQGHN